MLSTHNKSKIYQASITEGKAQSEDLLQFIFHPFISTMGDTSCFCWILWGCKEFILYQCSLFKQNLRDTYQITRNCSTDKRSNQGSALSSLLKCLQADVERGKSSLQSQFVSAEKTTSTCKSYISYPI